MSAYIMCPCIVCSLVYCSLIAHPPHCYHNTHESLWSQPLEVSWYPLFLGVHHMFVKLWMPTADCLFNTAFVSYNLVYVSIRLVPGPRCPVRLRSRKAFFELGHALKGQTVVWYCCADFLLHVFAYDLGLVVVGNWRHLEFDAGSKKGSYYTIINRHPDITRHLGLLASL